MMLPERCAIMIGAACFMPSITERTSRAMAASKPSTGIAVMLPVGAGPPALLNSASSRPKALVRLADHPLPVVLERGIGLHEAPGLAEPGRQGVALRPAAAGEDYLGTLLHEQLGRAPADAAGRPRDDGDLAVEHAPWRFLSAAVCGQYYPSGHEKQKPRCGP